MGDTRIEYRTFGGVFHELDNGIRYFDSNTLLGSFDNFESAYEHYKNFDIELAYQIVQNLNLDCTEGRSVFKRLERIEFGKCTLVDVVSFDEYNGYED